MSSLTQISTLPFRLVELEDIMEEYNKHNASEKFSEKTLRSFVERATVKHKWQQDIFPPEQQGRLFFKKEGTTPFHSEDDPLRGYFVDTMLDVLKTLFPLLSSHFTHENMATNAVIPGMGKFSKVLNKAFKGYSITEASNCYHNDETLCYIPGFAWKCFKKAQAPSITWERVFQAYYNAQPDYTKSRTSYFVLSNRIEDILSCSFYELTSCQELQNSCFNPDGESYGGAPTSLAMNENSAIFYAYDSKGVRTGRLHVFIVPETKSIIWGRNYGRVPNSVIRKVSQEITRRLGWEGELNELHGDIRQDYPENFYADEPYAVFSLSNIDCDDVKLYHPDCTCLCCGNTHNFGALFCEDCLSRVRCHECGELFEEEDTQEFDGHVFCIRCLDTFTTACHHCGEHVLDDDVYRTADGYNLCSSCYEEETTTCADCGDTHYYTTSNGAFSRHHNYCCDCVVQCSECGEWIGPEETCKCCEDGAHQHAA